MTCVRIFTAVKPFCIIIWSPVSLSLRCRAPQYLHISMNMTYFCQGWGVTLCVCVCVCLRVCHSGGRTITVTGQGFDLVQSATMQVPGVGQTVSNQLNCFSFNRIIKLVGWDTTEKKNVFKALQCRQIPSAQQIWYFAKIYMRRLIPISLLFVKFKTKRWLA